MLASRLNIGSMDRRIIIQRSNTSRDEFNRPSVSSWTNLHTVWARVEEFVGNESYQAEQNTAIRTTKFTIRFVDDVKEEDRILYNERYYNVVSITIPNRDRVIELKASLLDET